ncbi:NAD(P)-binding protein [Lipomyces oligophaga]|uniref:NAD(P)-binding protein n=1 Tax=Lipomyces oligophaga TaxID=45792 RepID=UPI0034CDD1BD
MKVLILGASGFIGHAVALAFVSAGYQVYGQSRNDSSIVRFRQDEITPLIGEPTDVIRIWAKGMDVVIDCCRTGPKGQFCIANLEAVLAACVTRSPQHKLTYIYTSGTWTHGTPACHDELGRISERAPIGTNLTPLIAWRAEFETRIFAAPTSEPGGASFRPIVIRPGLLYGRSMSFLHSLFLQAYTKNHITWPGISGQSRYNTIHQDDLARLFLLVAERAPIFGGLAVDAVNPQTESADDVLNALIAAAGGDKTYSLYEPVTDLDLALCVVGRHQVSLGYTLAGWIPRKAGLVDGMRQYYEAWKAYQ